MTTTTELKDIRRKAIPLTPEMAILLGVPYTQQDAEKLQTVMTYKNRDRIPEHLLKYADLYNELTKQEAVSFTDWIATFEDWKSHGLLEEHIRAAWLEANKDNGGFSVGRPGALTVTAISAKSKMVGKTTPQINGEAIDATKKMIEEKESKPTLSREELRERLEADRARIKARLANSPSRRMLR